MMTKLEKLQRMLEMSAHMAKDQVGVVYDYKGEDLIYVATVDGSTMFFIDRNLKGHNIGKGEASPKGGSASPKDIKLIKKYLKKSDSLLNAYGDKVVKEVQAFYKKM